jgi:rhamnose utilization protein RhaD (predicted bifunctional aldolase and dehydrogenase)
MSNAAAVLQAVVQMSRRLGEPERDLVILGEGNTSGLCDEGTFWVKASGTELRTIAEDGFVQMRLGEVAALADGADLSDEGIKDALNAARVDPQATRRPSVETVLHALTLVVCGPAPVLVPYTDPGLPLARTVRDAYRRYGDEYGQAPKVVVMQNHGLIALGRTPQEVDNITAMFVKTCRVLAGTFAFGGPRFLRQEDVERIHTRPDEAYRRQQLKIE